MCVCVCLLVCRLFLNKTKDAVNIFKLGDFTPKYRFLASVWNIRKSGRTWNLSPQTNVMVQSPHKSQNSASLRLQCSVASPVKRKLPLATPDEGPGGRIEEPRQWGHRSRAQSGCWEGAGDLALTLFHRLYLSSSSACFVLLDTETLEGNSDSNLLFAQLIIWGSQKVGENNNFPSSCSWPS